jgi:hypothetical protein
MRSAILSFSGSAIPSPCLSHVGYTKSELVRSGVRTWNADMHRDVKRQKEYCTEGLFRLLAVGWTVMWCHPLKQQLKLGLVPRSYRIKNTRVTF